MIRLLSKQGSMKSAVGKATDTKRRQEDSEENAAMLVAMAIKPVAAKSIPAARKAATRKAVPRKPTPAQALARTKELLAQKQAHDREVQPWQQLDPQHTHVAEQGRQSLEAADKVTELHAAESRMKAIQGSIGTQDRHNQGKRDKR